MGGLDVDLERDEVLGADRPPRGRELPTGYVARPSPVTTGSSPCATGWPDPAPLIQSPTPTSPVDESHRDSGWWPTVMLCSLVPSLGEELVADLGIVLGEDAARYQSVATVARASASGSRLASAPGCRGGRRAGDDPLGDHRRTRFRRSPPVPAPAAWSQSMSRGRSSEAACDGPGTARAFSRGDAPRSASRSSSSTWRVLTGRTRTTGRGPSPKVSTTRTRGPVGGGQREFTRRGRHAGAGRRAP